MAKAHVHAESSVRRFGGKVEDYLSIHLLLDSSKSAIADNRHRALTHTSWFISSILPRIFGDTFVNSEGKCVSVCDVAEQHVLEDYGGRFVPTPQDFLGEMEFKEWMQNGRGYPASYSKIAEKDRKKAQRLINS